MISRLLLGLVASMSATMFHLNSAEAWCENDVGWTLIDSTWSSGLRHRPDEKTLTVRVKKIAGGDGACVIKIRPLATGLECLEGTVWKTSECSADQSSAGGDIGDEKNIRFQIRSTSASPLSSGPMDIVDLTEDECTTNCVYHHVGTLNFILYVLIEFQGLIRSLGGLSFSSNGLRDVVVLKLSPSGAILWTRQIGGSGDQEALSLRWGGESVIVSTAFRDQLQVGGQSHFSNGNYDAMVLRLAQSSGSVMWTSQIGGSGNERLPALHVTPDGRILVAGSFQNSIQVGSKPLSSNGALDGLVVEYYVSTSVPTFLHQFGGSGSAEIEGIVRMSNDDIAVAGDFTQDIDPSIGQPGDEMQSIGLSDLFVAKLNSGGVHLQSRHYGSSGADNSGGLGIDSNDNLYAVGGFSGQLYEIDGSGQNYLGISPLGGTDGFVLSLGANFGTGWKRNLGWTNNDDIFAVRVDSADRVWIAGAFNGAGQDTPPDLYFAGILGRGVGYGPGLVPGPAAVVSESASQDSFLAAYGAATGQILWGEIIGSTGAFESARAIASVNCSLPSTCRVGFGGIKPAPSTTVRHRSTAAQTVMPMPCP